MSSKGFMWSRDRLCCSPCATLLQLCGQIWIQYFSYVKEDLTSKSSAPWTIRKTCCRFQIYSKNFQLLGMVKDWLLDVQQVHVEHQSKPNHEHQTIAHRDYHSESQNTTRDPTGDEMLHLQISLTRLRVLHHDCSFRTISLIMI